MHTALLRVSALAVIALPLAGCQLMFGAPPGKGAKARDGIRKAGPVIAALEKFRGDRRHYPKKLDELIPDYLRDRTFGGYM
jgi:hypothetical protein